MSNPTAMTQARAPIPDGDDVGRKLYQGLLERRALMLSYENLRLRACLERATGTQWDSTDFTDMTSEQMDEIVINEIATGLRMSIEDATNLVRQNKAMANPSQVEKATGA